jgi:hypothetical protein
MIILFLLIAIISFLIGRSIYKNRLNITEREVVKLRERILSGEVNHNLTFHELAEIADKENLRIMKDWR